MQVTDGGLPGVFRIHKQQLWLAFKSGAQWAGLDYDLAASLPDMGLCLSQPRRIVWPG